MDFRCHEMRKGIAEERREDRKVRNAPASSNTSAVMYSGRVKVYIATFSNENVVSVVLFRLRVRPAGK
jgi:hypothetical protein